MLSRSEIQKSVAKIERTFKLDETGNLHPFYAYSVPVTEEAILKIAGTIDAPKKARDENVKFFKDKENLVHVVERDRVHFGGRDKVPAMEMALFGMRQLQGFLFSEATTQSTPGPNRGGKTRSRMQKLISISLGFDPLRPGYEFPFDASRGPIIIWSCVPAKNTRTELMDLQRLIPPGYKYKLFTAKGDERIEFDPTPMRPHGCVIRIKSYSMPVDQFQREAVHVISLDEKCPQYIWDECRMRLISTSGWMILAMALYDLELWLYEKNKKFAPEYRALLDGPFAWYSWYQSNCPWLNQSRAAEEAEGLGEDERAARTFGDPKLLTGSSYFKPTETISELWKKHSRSPVHSLKFTYDGKPSVGEYAGRKGWRLWDVPQAGYTYAIGADVAEGLGGDHDSSTAHVYCLDTSEVVAVFEDNTIEADEFGLELLLAGRFWNAATIAIEVNVERAATHHWLKQHGYPRIYKRMTFGGRIDNQQESHGWYTDSRSKNWALEDLRKSLKSAHEEKEGGVILYDSATYEQISDFGYLRERRHKAHGLGALSGHDDLVMSLAIALQAASQAPKPEIKKNQEYFTSQAAMRAADIFKRQEAKQGAEDVVFVD